MFHNCSSIKELPDISNLNFSNVINMSYIFSGCKLLKELPDISKWDTNQLINIEGMFENCESLPSLPDLSNWNKNKNINYKQRLFRNCKTLESLPDLSNLFSEEDLKNDYIFEGCEKLEDKFNENKENEETCLERLNYICNKYCPFFNRIHSCLKFGLYFLSFIFVFSCGIFLSRYIYYHILNLSLDASKEFFNDPKTYSFLLNYINISNIAIVKNITNSTEIKEILDNKEDFINKEMNFTYINDNIKFEISQKYLIAYSIIIFSAFLLNFSILIFIIIFYNCLAVISPIIVIIVITIFLLTNVFSIIIEIKDLIITNHLSNSINIFDTKLKELFGLEFSETISNEYNSLNESFISIIVHIFFSLFFILLFAIIYENIVNERKVNKNYIYEKNKNIFASNINELI